MTHGPDAQPRAISIALEGGGAMEAFVWGVLDRLLEEPSISIQAASGTSGGALNAALLVQGLADGGPAEAKRLLAALWDQVARDLGEPSGSLGDAVFETKVAMAPMTDSIRAIMEASKGAVTAYIPGLGPNTRHPSERHKAVLGQGRHDRRAARFVMLAIEVCCHRDRR